MIRRLFRAGEREASVAFVNAATADASFLPFDRSTDRHIDRWIDRAPEFKISSAKQQGEH